MKRYLNSKEMNDLLFIYYLTQIDNEIVDNWVKRSNMTSNEAKWIRTAITYNKKAIGSILERLEDKEIQKFMKRTIRADNEEVRIVDKWMKDRIFGTYETEFEIVKVERPEFEKLCLACIQSYCEDCKESFSNCDIYDVFENNIVSRAEIKHNCPYAYYSEETIKKIKALEAEAAKIKKDDTGKKKISKRKQRKIKNRFDED